MFLEHALWKHILCLPKNRTNPYSMLSGGFQGRTYVEHFSVGGEE